MEKETAKGLDFVKEVERKAKLTELLERMDELSKSNRNDMNDLQHKVKQLKRKKNPDVGLEDFVEDCFAPSITDICL